VLCAAVYECVAAPALVRELIAGPEFRPVMRGSSGRPGGLSTVGYRLEEAQDGSTWSRYSPKSAGRRPAYSFGR
jgi:hypothetical protein